MAHLRSLTRLQSLAESACRWSRAAGIKAVDTALESDRGSCSGSGRSEQHHMALLILPQFKGRQSATNAGKKPDSLV
jgi:hypothetical protein